VPFLVTCPSCRTSLKAPDNAAGQQLRCPKCGGLIGAHRLEAGGGAPLVVPEPSFFYTVNRQKVGPVPLFHLRRLASAGQLRPADMVLREGARTWVEAGTVADLFPGGSMRPAVPPAVEPLPVAEAVPVLAVAPAPPPQRRRFPVLLLLLLPIPVGLITVCCGVLRNIENSRAAKALKEALKEADADYAEGRHEQAVAVYKQHFSLADDKPTILKRIVEHEAEKGNEHEAREWIEKGIDQELEVAYDGPAARLYAENKQAGNSTNARLMAMAFVTKALRLPDEEGTIPVPTFWDRQDDLSWKVYGTLPSKKSALGPHFFVHIKKVSAEDWILLDIKLVLE
jgi:hypothetical protein